MQKKLKIAALPTPIVKLESLSAKMGKNIWLKRDDLTGIECSGNKVRKLEYIFSDILDNGYDTAITCGGKQSNHCRAVASCSARYGVKCIMYLNGEDDGRSEGNVFLDKLFGAEIIYLSDDKFKNIKEIMAQKQEELKNSGSKAYLIPLGGSTSLGASGYIDCYNEIADFEAASGVRFDAITVSVGSGGTYSGLILGSLKAGSKRPVYGINISADAQYFTDEIYSICKGYEENYDSSVSVNKEEILILDGYVGEGYGIASEEVINKIIEIARTEGIVLDPVYTGKAFYGVLSEIEKGRFDGAENILFIHTGGIYGVLAQAENFRF